MAIKWRLREAMLKNNIRNSLQLHKALDQSLGIIISREALGKLMQNQPSNLRLETAQYLCTLLQVPLNEILVITPEPIIRNPVPIQPFVKKYEAESLMVDPGDFF